MLCEILFQDSFCYGPCVYLNFSIDACNQSLCIHPGVLVCFLSGMLYRSADLMYTVGLPLIRHCAYRGSRGLSGMIAFSGAFCLFIGLVGCSELIRQMPCQPQNAHMPAPAFGTCASCTGHCFCLLGP